MDDLIAFLNARFVDLEEDCRAGPWPLWNIKPSEMATRIRYVLDDVAVKRQMVELVSNVKRLEDDDATLFAACLLRLLALPFSGHPDFREEWRTA